MEEQAKQSYSVREVAKILKLTTRGVRYRLDEGKLDGAQIDGKWVVYLSNGKNKEDGTSAEDIAIESEEQEDERFRYRTEQGKNGTSSASSPVMAPSEQLRMVMDEWVKPLVDEIKELSRANGDLAARLEESERQRMALVEALEEDISPGTVEGQSSGIWNALRRFVTSSR